MSTPKVAFIDLGRQHKPLKNKLLILVKMFRNLLSKSLILMKLILLLDDITIQIAKLFEISILKYAGLMVVAKKC